MIGEKTECQDCKKEHKLGSVCKMRVRSARAKPEHRLSEYFVHRTQFMRLYL